MCAPGLWVRAHGHGATWVRPVARESREGARGGCAWLSGRDVRKALCTTSATSSALATLPMICPHCKAQIQTTTKRSMLVKRIGQFRRRKAVAVPCAIEAKAVLVALLEQGARPPISLEATKQHGLVATWWTRGAEVAAIWITARGHTHVHQGPAWVQRDDWCAMVLESLTRGGLCGPKSARKVGVPQQSTDDAIAAGASGEAAPPPGHRFPLAEANEGGAPAGFSRGPNVKSRGKRP